MKTIILTLTAVLVAIAASAQTSFTTSKLAIAADDGGMEIDFDSIKSAIDQNSGFVFKIKEYQGSSIDIGSIMQSMNGAYTIPGSITTSYVTINIPNYTLTVGKRYQVQCYLPSDFWFKLMCHNPYDNFRVRIFGADSSGNICFKQTIGTVWYNNSLVVGSH